jgi:hypothetical protein
MRTLQLKSRYCPVKDSIPSRQQVQCFKCGEEGHFARECSNLQYQKCGQSGHKTADCTIILADEEEREPLVNPWLGGKSKQHLQGPEYEEMENLSPRGSGEETSTPTTTSTQAVNNPVRFVMVGDSLMHPMKDSDTESRKTISKSGCSIEDIVGTMEN